MKRSMTESKGNFIRAFWESHLIGEQLRDKISVSHGGTSSLYLSTFLVTFIHSDSTTPVLRDGYTFI